MANYKELEKKYYMQTGVRLPLTIVKGKDSIVWDENGKEYLDFVAGWAVNCLGHCPDVLIEAVKKQAETLIQTSNNFYTVPQLQIAELLVKNSCLDRAFFSNSGAEANEGAVKLARRYGKLRLNGAYEVITATGSFHGRTLAMVSASGQPKHQEPYTPLPSGCINVQFDDIEAIKKATNENTCAVMLEPIQGESGVNLPSEGYLAEVRSWCDEKGILLILDEVQTGIGRTGKLFAYEHYGVQPDIMTLAKGLGGGMPIGAIMAKESVSVFAPGEHGSTFGGNPVTCAAAYAVVKHVIENNISENAHVIGNYLKERLEELKAKHSQIIEIRGKGLLTAIEFDSDSAAAIRDKCLENGLLTNSVKASALRLMPALTINKADVDRAVEILDASISEVFC